MKKNEKVFDILY